MNRKYLKPAEAADKLGVTVETLGNWRWKRIGPPWYVDNKMVRYADDEVDALIEAGRQSPGEAQ